MKSFYNKNIDKTAIEELYKNRVSPVTKFDSNIISTCSNLLNSTERSLFLKEWKNKGGIYLIRYKYDPYIYYIGRTNKFGFRLISHIKHRLNDRFHLFAKIVGWE